MIPSIVAKASSRSVLLSPATGESTDSPGINQKLNQDAMNAPAPGIIVGGKIAVLLVGPDGHLTSFMLDESPSAGPVNNLQAVVARTASPWRKMIAVFSPSSCACRLFSPPPKINPPVLKDCVQYKQIVPVFVFELIAVLLEEKATVLVGILDYTHLCICPLGSRWLGQGGGALR